jgi:hypothetical protein
MGVDAPWCVDSQPIQIQKRKSFLHNDFGNLFPIQKLVNRYLQVFQKNFYKRFVEMTGFEPVTSWLQTTRSPN